MNAPTTEWTIPRSWEWSRMGEIASVIGGGTPRTDDPSNYEGGEIAWITPADLSGYTHKYIQRGARNITQRGLENSGARTMPAGTVLFSSRAPIGYVAIAANPVSTNQGFKSFVLTEDLSPDYIYYYLQRAKETARGLASGTTFLEISGAKATIIPVPVAPRPEQDRIVAEIEKQFTRLDDAVAALKRVQANLKRYRASVLKAACEGRLVPTEAELARKEGRNYEPASELLKRILAERRAKWEADQLQKMIAAGKPPKNETWKKNYRGPGSSDISHLPELPEGWIWTTVGYLFDCIVPNRDKPKSFSGKIPWITLPDFGEEIEISESRSGLGLTLDEVENYRARLVPSGSVVMSCIGRFGIAAVLTNPSVINQQLHAFVVPDWLPARYFAYALQNQRSYMESISTSTTIAYLNKDNCNSVPIPLPPRDEQLRIIERIDQLFSGIAVLEKNVKQELRHATAMRNSILVAAFSGKLAPQDPNDEPASVLLDRIRAERAALATNNGNQKATPKAGTANGQRRRRVARLAQGVSPGKG